MAKIDLWQLWLALKSNTNTKQGGHLRLRDFNSWVNQASLEIFKEDFAAWQKTQILTDDLRAFLVSKPVTTKPSTMNYVILQYPQDYAFFSSARIFQAGGEVVECAKEGEEVKNALADVCEISATLVDNARWGSVCSHKIIPPSVSKNRVYITQFDGGFKVAPKEVGYVTLDYLRFPKKAILAFDSTKLPDQVYDPVETAKNPLEWSDTVMNEFLARLEISYSKFIREPFLLNASLNKKETTV